MKIQRRRVRPDVSPNSNSGSHINGIDEAMDGDLSDAEEMEEVDLSNEVEAHLEATETSATSTNGYSNSSVSANGSGSQASDGSANGPAATAPRTVVPNLPRCRPRVEPQADTLVEVAPPAIEAPADRRRSGKRSPSFAPVATAPIPAPPARPVAAPKETIAHKAFRLVVTYENLIYLTIFMLAIVTRFWDVGNRGIHHDESLHSVYSRNLYLGTGYTHDPMMHGPLQFNFISIMYWLFGTTDATARYASVLCGIFVVMSPFFLRKQMGRWPALIASFLLLVSPTVLYFGRMAREDSVYSGMEMLMIVGLWRFVSTRRPADFFVFMAGLSLMFTIKETAYLTLAVIGVFFVVMFALQAGYAILGALAGYGAVMGGFYLYISGQMKSGTLGKLPDIPATNPDYDTIMRFVGLLFGHPLVQGAILVTLLFVGVLAFLFISQRRKLAAESWVEAEAEAEAAPMVRRRPVRQSNPNGAGAATVPMKNGATLPSRKVRQSVEEAVVVETNGQVGPVAVPIAASTSETQGEWADGEYADAERMEATEVWDPKRLDPKPGSFLGRYQPGSIPYLVGSLFGRPSVLLIGFVIAAAIFVVLYTVFFTDVPRGIVSGLFASLGYWMAQQGVERGGQPWFYYLLIIPLYEPIAIFFSFVATIFFSVKGIKALFRRREERYETGEPGMGLFNIDRSVPFARFSVFLPLFIIWWLLGAFFLYSWAGEKMPWLTVHMTRPAILLASLFLGALLASIIARRQERMAEEGVRVQYEPVAEMAPIPAMPTRRPGSSSPVGNRRRFETAQAQAYIPPPPRRRGPVARLGPRIQEPPWVAWNRAGSKFPVVSFLAIFVVLIMAWGLKMNALTAKSDFTGWGVSWVYPGLIAILIISYSVWLGPARAFRYVALAIFSIFFIYQFKSATALAYQHPDVPIEMATYVQTSPDVTRTVSELTDYSNFATGGTNAKVIYDSFASWPYEWYLRDYKNKSFIASGDPSPGPDSPIMFLEYAKHNNDANLSDYVVQRYAMRWWFPEELYKNDLMPGLDPKSAPVLSQIGAAFSTIKDTIFDGNRASGMWKYLVFRDLPKPLGSEDMVLALRKDIAQEWHYIQYNPPVLDNTTQTIRNPNQ